MASGLGGGVGGSQQEMCGALSGGVLVLGCLFGPAGAGEDRQFVSDRVAQYRERFAERFGATRCAPLRQRIEAESWLPGCDVLVEHATEELLTFLAEVEPELD